MKTRLHVLILMICLLLSRNASAIENKKALVIGNSKYQHAERLVNPARDASAIAQQLRKLGFEVLEKKNLSLRQMKSAIASYHELLDENSVSVVYYAGHGVQKNERNYLIPVDANIVRSYEIEFTSIDLQMALSAIDEANPRLNLVLLDACRDNPFEKKIAGASRGRHQANGLSAVNGAHGTILSYSTQPGNIAVDGKGDHSPYASALLSHLAKPGVSVQELLNNVGLDVMASTKGNQVPWFSSSPIPGYCLAGCEGPKQFTDKSNRVAVLPQPIKTLVMPTHYDQDPLKTAIQNKDLQKIRRLVELSNEDEQRLTSIFKNYNDIVIAKVESSRSLQKSSNKQSKVVNNYLLLEVTNNHGNRVLPSDSWRNISLSLRDPK